MKTLEEIADLIKPHSAIIDPHYDSNGYLDGGWVIHDGVITGHIDPRGEKGDEGVAGFISSINIYPPLSDLELGYSRY